MFVCVCMCVWDLYYVINLLQSSFADKNHTPCTMRARKRACVCL